MLQDTQLLRRSAWYRLQCDVERLTAGSDVARVRLTVVDVAIGAVRQSRSAWTRIGPVTPAKHALLVGGVTPSGTRGNDQLEGDVDRLIVDVT